MSTPYSELGPVARIVRRFTRDQIGMLALGYIVALVAIAVLADVVARHDPAQLVARPFQGPSGAHWLGTDDIGRDVFSRIVWGTRLSVVVSVGTVGFAVLVGVPIGIVAGYWSGRIGYVLMRLMDAMMSLPALVLAIALVAVLGANLRNTMIAVGVVLIPLFARLTRSEALAVREESFIEASRATGTPHGRIVLRRLLPNILPPIIVQVSISLGIALLAEASLSFLGLGAQPPDVSWGFMLQSAYEVMLAHPWQLLPPGLAIALTVLAYNSVGDALLESIRPEERTARVPGHGTRHRRGITTSLVAAPRPAGGLPEPTPAEPAGDPDDARPVLEVTDLTVDFASDGRLLRVVDGVSLSIGRGEVLGLVGESGSGKTVTSLSIMRLLASPPAQIAGGSVRFDGIELLDLSFGELRALRGSEIAMVFQDPNASLNPALTVGHQIGQALKWHEGLGRRTRRARVGEVLEQVGISPDRAAAYPHEFSGGMRQRVMIAMAVACRPRLMILDEPTSALDVTVQAQILELLHDLRQEFGMSMLFVTHDLGVVSDLCDRVAVMYAGQLVETAPVVELFADPRHPYTQALLAAMPQNADIGTALATIPGRVPQPAEYGSGCRFAGRCSYETPDCVAAPVPFVPIGRPGDDRLVRCIRADELAREEVR